MTINLPPELEALILERVQSGLYSSPAEVVRESLRLLKERDELQRQRHEELRREILLAAEAGKEGRFTICNTDEELGKFGEEIKQAGLKELEHRKTR